MRIFIPDLMFVFTAIARIFLVCVRVCDSHIHSNALISLLMHLSRAWSTMYVLEMRQHLRAPTLSIPARGIIDRQMCACLCRRLCTL